MEEKVKKWLAEGCDFEAGLVLLASTGSRHKQLVKTMSGRAHRYAVKLKYELMKEAGLKSVSLDLSATPITTTAAPVTLVKGTKPAKNETPDKTGKTLPKAVEDLIKIYSDAFKTRAILHEQMGEMPTENTPDLVSRRKRLVEEIARLTAIVETGHKAKEDFYVNGIVPDVEKLFAAPAPAAAEKELPADVDELKKMKKNLQSANTKDQFMLDYRQKTKGERENPLPVGPKRAKLEGRIAEREEKIKLIDYKLLPTPK